MDETLLQATIYLGAMLIAVPISVRFGLGSVLGYLLAGVAIGPVLGLVGSETEDLQHYAEFGVVLMLFLIGLELDPSSLWDMRKRLLGMGGSQIALSIAVLAGGAWMLGLAAPLALAVGMTLALSSTAIVLTTLTEKGLMRTKGGRGAFSVLLTQDVAVIPALAVLPLLATASGVTFTENGSISRRVLDDAHHSISLVEGLPAWGVTLVTLAAVVAVILGGRYLSPVIFRLVQAAKLPELLTVAALLYVVGIAVVMLLVGLSPALGAFLAGVVLANSEFRHEMEANIEPFKGLLLGLFFITVGAGIKFTTLFGAPFTILGLTIAVIVLKGGVLYAIARAFRLRGRDLWLFTLGLAQAGEFGFVLVAFGVQQSVFPDRIAGMLLLVVALSMLLTPLSFIIYERISKRMADGAEPRPEDDTIDEEGTVIIAGVGRFGQVVNRFVRASGFKTVVLDSNLETIQLMRKFGLKSFFGDPTRPELLNAAGLATAKVLVVAVDNKASAVKLVKYAKRQRPDISVVARAYDLLHVYELHEAGADHIVREMFDGSLRAGRYVVEDMGLSDYEAHELEMAFYRHDRQNLRELAEVWQPGVPVTENAEYMRLTREFTDNLERAMATQLGEMAAEGREDRSSSGRSDGDVSALGEVSRNKLARQPSGRQQG